MITFDVVKEEHGWAVRMGERMTTPFRSRRLAIQEANCLAEAIRRHGESTQVIVEGVRLDEPPSRFRDASPARVNSILYGRRPGPQ